MILMNIAGGVALILFGVRSLRKGLERMPGQGLHGWIQRMAQRRWTATVAGAAIGAVAPSSTAQTLLALQLVNSEGLPAERTLAYLLGADIGITSSVQLIALHIYDTYPYFLAAGVLGFQFFKNEYVRGVGQSLLGLGFFYLAMSTMGGAARALSADPDFSALFAILPHHPFLLVLFAAGLTFALQSTTATIGLGMALCEGGLTELSVMVPVVLGANLGVGIISLAAGWTTPSGRRLAAGNLVMKLAALAVSLWALGPLMAIIAKSPGTVGRQIADWHTAFNAAVALAGLAMAVPLNRLLDRLFRTPEPGQGEEKSSHLDPSALDSPLFALANASRETLRLADEVKGMFEEAWQATLRHDAALAREVQARDDRVDALNAAIKLYLSRLPGETLTPADRELQFGLLNFSSQLESVGDIVDKHLCAGVIKHAREAPVLLPEDRADLEAMHGKVVRRLEESAAVLATRDRGAARRFLREGEELERWYLAAERRHFERLKAKAGDPAAAASSKRFLDLLDDLRRISGELGTIGETFAGGRPPGGRRAV